MNDLNSTYILVLFHSLITCFDIHQSYSQYDIMLNKRENRLKPRKTMYKSYLVANSLYGH